MPEKLSQNNHESSIDDNGWGTPASEANRKAWESDLQEDVADVVDTEKVFDPSAAENNRKAWESEVQNQGSVEESEDSIDEENYDVNTWGGFKSDRREAVELGITTESEYNEWRSQKYPEPTEKVNQSERFKDKKSWRDFENEGGTNGQEYKDWLDYKKATDPINVMKKLKELEANYDEQKFHGTRGGFMDAKNELYRFKTENGEIIDEYNQKEAEKATEAEAKRVSEAEKATTEAEKNNEVTDQKDDSDQFGDKLELHSLSEAEVSKIDARVDSDYADSYESAVKTYKNVGLVMENDTDKSERAPFNTKTSKDMGYIIKVLMDANHDKLQSKVGEIVQQDDWQERDDAHEIEERLKSEFDFLNDQFKANEDLKEMQFEADKLSIKNVESETLEKMKRNTPKIAEKIEAAKLEKDKLFQAELDAQQESHDHSQEKISWGFWKKAKEAVTRSHKRKQKKLNEAVKSAKESRLTFRSEELDKFNADVDAIGYKKQQALYNKIKKYM